MTIQMKAPDEYVSNGSVCVITEEFIFLHFSWRQKSKQAIS